MQYRVPVPDWSKAPWGLSVLAQVTSIFTGSSISPGVLLRQCPNHSAFRAGRNLPAKEFRYLRTVIVTAAVYWGLDVYKRQEIDNRDTVRRQCIAAYPFLFQTRCPYRIQNIIDNTNVWI